MQRALTSTSSNTLGINWNKNSGPECTSRHQSLTSVLLHKRSKSLQPFHWSRGILGIRREHIAPYFLWPCGSHIHTSKTHSGNTFRILRNSTLPPALFLDDVSQDYLGSVKGKIHKRRCDYISGCRVSESL